MENQILTKTCTTCGLPKSEAEFYVKDKATGRRDTKCKACAKSDRQVYYEENKDQIAVTHRTYYEANKEKTFADVTKWGKEHPDKVREYNRNTVARLRENDPDELKARRRRKEQRALQNPAYRLGKALRQRLRHVMNGKARTGSSVRDLGCSLDELKIHLEKQWVEGMSWGTYGNGLGKWNIDHIVPLTAFELTDRQHVVVACHYQNLRPMWSHENSAKGAKLDFQFQRAA